MAGEGRVRSATASVTFDGQSLVLYPGDGVGGGFPVYLMAEPEFAGIPWTRVAIGGMPWERPAGWGSLATTQAARSNSHAKEAAKTILIGHGGTSDIWDGDSAATLLANEKAYAQAARAAGFDKIIWVTLGGNTVNTGGQNTIRLAHNVDLLAEPLYPTGDFDAIVDLDAVGLGDGTGANYLDGTHYNATGAQLCAATLKPYLIAQLAA